MPAPTKPTPPPPAFTLVHLPGLPCGAPSGRFGTGWGALTCEACIKIADPTPTPPAAKAEE